jgi:hypothetical protein
VVQGGYKPTKDKKQNITETIQGGLDVAVGSMYEQHSYLIRLRQQEEDSNFGTKDDLDFFYSLMDPAPTSGSPGLLITLTDHYGATKHGYMDGQFTPEPVTTVLEGIYAWFMVPITIRIKPE